MSNYYRNIISRSLDRSIRWSSPNHFSTLITNIRPWSPGSAIYYLKTISTRSKKTKMFFRLRLFAKIAIDFLTATADVKPCRLRQMIGIKWLPLLITESNSRRLEARSKSIDIHIGRPLYKHFTLVLSILCVCVCVCVLVYFIL